MIFWILIVLVVIVIILYVMSNNRMWYLTRAMTGIISVVLGMIVLIMTPLIACEHLGAEVRIEVYQKRYEILSYQRL